MIPDPQRVRDDRQARIHRPARREERAVDDVKVRDVVRATIRVQDARPGIDPESASPVLMPDRAERGALLEKGSETERVVGMPDAFQRVNPGLPEPVGPRGRPDTEARSPA
jgi:hypothetical protein